MSLGNVLRKDSILETMSYVNNFVEDARVSCIIRMAFKTSPVWKISKGEFSKICKQSNSIAEILRHVGLKEDGNYKTVKARIREENMDISHIRLGLSHLKNTFARNRYSKEEAVTKLTKGLIHNRSQVKALIRRHNIIPHSNCNICGQGEIWNGKPLALQLDHIDGDSSNDKLENFRFLCPHCHSQTETFSGRNK